MNKWKDLILRIRKLAQEGLFHIFGSSVLAKMMGLLSSVVVVRQLPKVEYGYFVSANNLYAYLATFVGIGLSNAVIQYCSEPVDENRKDAIYHHGLVSGSLRNLVVAAGIVTLSFWKEAAGDTEVAYYLRLMCGLPFVAYLDDYQLVVLRVKLKNQVYSYANMVNSVSLLVSNVVFTMLFGISGLIYSMYLSFILSSAISGWALYREGFYRRVFRGGNRLRGKEKREIDSFAFVSAITRFASTVLLLLDVTCLDLILGDPAVLADYKVAMTVPAACAFIPSCLTTFLYPKMVAAFSDAKRSGMASLKKLFQLFIGINGLAYLCLALFAPLIIWVVFGARYMNVVLIFEILSLEYLAYSARTLLSNVISILKKVKVNLVFSVVSGVAKIGLNLFLIQMLGSTGAALSTLGVSVLVMALELWYLNGYFKKLHLNGERM